MTILRRQVVYHGNSSRTCRSRRRPAPRVAARRHLSGLRRGRPLLPADHKRDRRARRRAGHGGGGPQALPRPSSEQDAARRWIRSGNLLVVLGDLLRRRPAARLHALRAADGADPLRASSPAPAATSRSPAARVLAVARLRARHGAHLHDRGRGIRGRRPAGAGVLPEALDHRAVRGPVRRARARMFGVFKLQLPAALQTRLADAEQPAAAGHAPRHGGHGRAVVADRHRLRGAAAGRRARRHRPERRRVPRRAPRCSRSASAWARRCWWSAPRRASCCRRPARGWTRSRPCSACMLLGVAVWMLGRILPGPVTLALWAVLAFVAGYWLLDASAAARRASGADAVRRGLGALAMRLRRAAAGRRARRPQRSAAAAGRPCARAAASTARRALRRSSASRR